MQCEIIVQNEPFFAIKYLGRNIIGMHKLQGTTYNTGYEVRKIKGRAFSGCSRNMTRTLIYYIFYPIFLPYASLRCPFNIGNFYFFRTA